jgi:hypothetical protein
MEISFKANKTLINSDDVHLCFMCHSYCALLSIVDVKLPFCTFLSVCPKELTYVLIDVCLLLPFFLSTKCALCSVVRV